MHPTYEADFLLSGTNQPGERGNEHIAFCVLSGTLLCIEPAERHEVSAEPFSEVEI